MSDQQASGLIAVDVGSTWVKLGWFPTESPCDSPKIAGGLSLTAGPLPQPAEIFACQHREISAAEYVGKIGEWLSQFVEYQPHSAMASVSPVAAKGVAYVFSKQNLPAPQLLTADDLPITLELREPPFVGIDRLLSAVAVNRVRSGNRAAMIVDIGTACTVDLVSPQGHFLGGAILPGVGIAASSLQLNTSSLPLVRASDWDLPEHGLGKHTEAAIASGLYWGILGSVKILSQQYSAVAGHEPEVFLTGGDAPYFAEGLREHLSSLRHLPGLILSGIALVMAEYLVVHAGKS